MLAHSARGMKTLRGKRPDLVGRDRNLDLGDLRKWKIPSQSRSGVPKKKWKGVPEVGCLPACS